MKHVRWHGIPQELTSHSPESSPARQILRDTFLRLAALIIFLIGAAVLVFSQDTVTFRENPQHNDVYGGGASAGAPKE